ncbi:MAG TPA: pitrilysin family protein, partial [Chloroflexota bacterium]
LLRGTERRSAQALNETTDRVGAALTVDVGWHVVQVNGRCLQEDFDLLAELVADILQHPSFPSDELERVRGQVLTSLREEADSTRAQADRHFLEAAYPPGHPYRRRSSGTIPTVETIHRDDLVAYHRQHFRPDNLVVAVVGDVDFDRALDALARWTERWQPVGAAPSVEIPPAPPPNGLVRVRFPMEAKTQADLVVGRPALSRKDPDYYPLALANLVLGQLGLSGRLGERVRDELGLAYTVYSSLEASFGPGPWSVRAGVNPRDLDRAIEAIRGEIRRLLDQPITVEELQDAQSHLIGILHVALETSGGIAQRLLEIELFDLGLDYLERYPTLIRSVTREAALEASRRYLSADDVVVSTAGPPAP